MCAAERLPEITGIMEATQTINIIGAAAATKIRSRIETREGATGTKTTESRDTGRMVGAQTKTDTDFINERTSVQVRNTAFPEATPLSRKHRGGHSSDQPTCSTDLPVG